MSSELVTCDTLHLRINSSCLISQAAFHGETGGMSSVLPVER